jgi:hypothetical protein
MDRRWCKSVFSEALREAVARGEHKPRAFLELKMKAELAEALGAGNVKYVTLWNTKLRCFWVRWRKKDGRYRIGTEIGGRVDVESAFELWCFICSDVKLPRRPLVKSPRDVPVKLRFGLERVFEKYIRATLPGDWNKAKFFSDRKSYAEHYNNPMQVLSELGLVRFANTSWRLR